MAETLSDQSLTHEQLKKLFETSNAELIRENELIHARMNMFLTSQAFLLAAMGLSSKYEVIASTVIFVGIVSSSFTVISILTAIYVFFRFFNKIKKEILPPLLEHDPFSYVERHPWEIWAGFSASICIPMALLGAWLYLAFFVKFPLPVLPN